ncbi:MAG: MBOAT family protein [Pontiellaceae bacterium]|nr:MBOAT family protein [Pontiellaceae bacterium]MBN2784539.1 MBOAT family protein [Pontiellaceae bacterium]
MVFSSIVFLFFFLPVTLLIYHLLFLPVSLKHKRSEVWRHLANLFLLFSSLVFYFWGEGWLVWIIVASTFIDFFCGLLIAGALHKGRIEELIEGAPRTSLQRTGLCLSICSNLAFLGFFKYFNFGIDSFNAVVPEAWQLHDVLQVTLPLGISFYTFQSMSYTIDVYRGHVKATRNLIDFSAYVTLFPQLVAGPIVRYSTIADQLVHRAISLESFSSGLQRFILGLAKKVLIANTVARMADWAFSLSENELTTPLAWIGIVCYSLQIYYDFSGYSDMAIGLGRMFGFNFLENFDYPYIARSIQEFWRRWHISLSTWFRDYLYIPLGGNRKSGARTYTNLMTVFFLCGLWHGASWTFVVWGLYHGFFLIIERAGFKRLIDRMPGVLRHIYALLVIMGGWVFFASGTFSQSLFFLRAMAGFDSADQPVYYQDYLRPDLILAMVWGIVFSTPLLQMISNTGLKLANRVSGLNHPLRIIQIFGLILLLLFSAMFLASGTFNPFIYFRF